MVLEHRGIYAVPDDRHVPTGAETLGRHIAEARRRKDLREFQADAENVFAKGVRHHEDLYARWCRMGRRDKYRRFPTDHPIYRSIIVWELHVCRWEVTPTNELWMVRRSVGSRMKLCELSREDRRRELLSKKNADESKNEYDTASYSTH